MLLQWHIFPKGLTGALVTSEVSHTAAQPPVITSVAMAFDIKMDKATVNTVQLYYIPICRKQNTS